MEVDRGRAELAIDCIEQSLSVFLGNGDEKVTAFPNAVTAFERDYILTRISKLNGVSWEICRRREVEYITLHKESKDKVHFSLSNTSRQSLASLMALKQREPETSYQPFSFLPNKRKNFSTAHLQPNGYRPQQPDQDLESISNNGYANRLHINYPPLVPPPRASDEYATHRQNLPIWTYKDQILDSILNNRVTVVIGKTGSGKSTQVPQFIMDWAAHNKKPTKITSCLPDRLSIIAATSRVAAERGERIGVSVGYQARLESCRSPCTSILIYTTTELFLRSLVPPVFPVLSNLPYIILDDVHVRSASSDCVLTCLLTLLPMFQFRLILLCGEMDGEELDKYVRKNGISDCRFIHVEKEEPVQNVVHHLRDIKLLLAKHHHQLIQTSIVPATMPERQKFQTPMDTQYRCKCCNLPRSGHLVNSLIHRYLFLEDCDAAEEFTDLVLRHEVDVNGQHQGTGLDFIAAAAIKGDIAIVRRLFLMGANVTRHLNNGNDVMSILQEFRHPEVLKFMNFMFCNMPCPVQRMTNVTTSANLTLIRNIIQVIHSSSPLTEAILVYLSSYDEIMAMKEVLFSGNNDQLNPLTFMVCLLHVNTPCGDEKIAFEPAPDLIRKIILTTDAGDSLFIDDVVHVIDSGYMEQKGDQNIQSTVTGNTKVLISKTAAVGRMRRTTYRLYDFKTFQKMQPFATPEILYNPIQELCLYSASLLKSHKVVVDFFGQFLTPPSGYSVNKAFQELIEIGAMDKTRKMTPLGTYLLDFPVEPRFGKALIYATILRCLDPVLTIVAALSHRDVFKAPVNTTEQVRIQRRKQELSKESFSDHMSILQAFLEWENECASDGNNVSLKTNNISPGIFDMICAIRTDLLGQLRAFGFIRCRGAGNIKHLNTNSHNWSVVKGALIAALYPNVMRINQRTWRLRNAHVDHARFHPLSSVARDPLNPQQLPSVWAIYDDIQRTPDMALCRGCTLVSTLAMFVFGGSPYRNPDLGEACLSFCVRPDNYHRGYQIKLNDTIVVEGPKFDIENVLRIRKKFQHLLEMQLKKPGTVTTPADDKDLQAITLILTTEDRAAGLAQIDGIGQWPRHAGGSLLSVPSQGFTQSVTPRIVDSDEE